MKFLAICLIALVAGAVAQEAAAEPAAPAEEPKVNTQPVGPATQHLGFHAPQLYPAMHPYGMYGMYGGYGMMHPGMMGMPFGMHPGMMMHPGMYGMYGGFGAFPYTHPALAGQYNPAQHHPMAAGFPAPSVLLQDTQKAANKNKFFPGAYGAFPGMYPGAYGMHPFGGMYGMYPWMQQPTSTAQQFPGADVKPGQHPLLGGNVNPIAPASLPPTHPYPFPMHAGTKNAPGSPRPFTPFGQYYPGMSAAPYYPGMYAGYGFAAPTYFPGAASAPAGAAKAEAEANPAAQTQQQESAEPAQE